MTAPKFKRCWACDSLIEDYNKAKKEDNTFLADYYFSLYLEHQRRYHSPR